MHACGHDGHTTILVGTAQVLAALSRDGLELPRPVTFLFQPAEEGGAGGKRMLEDGCLDGSLIGPPVDRLFGLHGWPEMSLGQAGTRPGPLLASADHFEVELRGLGGHAAWPHECRDPVVAGAAVVQAVQTIVARVVDPLDAAVVSVTQFHAGTADNIIADTARLGGTVRALDERTRSRVQGELVRIVEQTAAAHRCEARLSYHPGYPVTENSADAVATFERAAREALGEASVERVARPVMGAEDFSYYCRAVPACFFFLGLRPQGVESIPRLHQSTFNFNDDAIAVGIELFCSLALA